MNDHRSSFAEPPETGRPWTVSAETSLQAVLDQPACHPLVCDSLTGVASWQIRVETPVRRALTSPRVAPRWVAALLALGATVTLSDDSGSHEVELAALLENRAVGKVLALHVPPGGAGRRWGQACVARTPADEPIVLACAVVEMDDQTVQQARVALLGAWPQPVRLAQAASQLMGGPFDAARIQAAASAVEQEVEARGDYLGSAEYRRAMAGVLSRRALAECLTGKGAGR